MHSFAINSMNHYDKNCIQDSTKLQDFGVYPKCLKLSCRILPVTDIVRNNRPKMSDQPSLFLSLAVVYTRLMREIHCLNIQLELSHRPSTIQRCVRHIINGLISCQKSDRIVEWVVMKWVIDVNKARKQQKKNRRPNM